MNSAAFKWEAVALGIDLLCCNFEKWNKQLYRDMPVSITKESQKEVSLLELSVITVNIQLVYLLKVTER